MRDTMPRRNAKHFGGKADFRRGRRMHIAGRNVHPEFEV
jgi:hypothetical protein